MILFANGFQFFFGKNESSVRCNWELQAGQLTLRSIVDILGLSTPLANNLPSLLRLPLLLFLQLLSGLFPQKKLKMNVYNTDDISPPPYPQFLLSLGGHEPLLGLLTSGLGLEPGPDLGLLPVDLGLLPEKEIEAGLE